MQVFSVKVEVMAVHVQSAGFFKAVEPVRLQIVDHQGDGAQAPGQGVHPVDHGDIPEDGRQDRQEGHPDNTPEGHHGHHGDHRPAGAPEDGGNTVGQGQQAVEQGAGSGLLDAEPDGVGLGGKGPGQQGRSDKDQHSYDLCQDDGAEHTESGALLGTLILLGAQVLADKGGDGHGKTGDGQEGKALDLGIGAAARHGHLAKGVDIGLDHHIGQSDDGVLEAGGQAVLDDELQGGQIKTDFSQLHLLGLIGTHQPDQAQEEADKVGDDGGQGLSLIHIW